jgi:hypothetical protein
VVQRQEQDVAWSMFVARRLERAARLTLAVQRREQNAAWPE